LQPAEKTEYVKIFTKKPANRPFRCEIVKKLTKKQKKADAREKTTKIFDGFYTK